MRAQTSTSPATAGTPARRTSLRSCMIALLLVPLAGIATAPEARAQGMFSAAVMVNDRAITNYEIDQRVRLLEAFNTPGDLREVAREQLIEDRLKAEAVARAGLEMTDAAQRAALEEFAGRANLTPEQFAAQLAAQGVSPETLRDFVAIGVSWRDYVRARFGPVSAVSEAEAEAAVGIQPAITGEIEVLLNEIIIAAPPDRAAAAAAEAERISTFTSTAAFEEAARRVSALPSRTSGGRLDWAPVSNYPAALRPLILGLSPGEVTAPIPIENGVALFQLRAVREAARAAPAPAEIEYATFAIPGGTSPAALQSARDLAARVDTCDDLYSVAQGLPERQLQRKSVAPEAIPQDVALELARLDRHEVSYNLTRDSGATLLFVMLCNRLSVPEAQIDLDAVRTQLLGQRLAAQADVLLAELRAAATITAR